MLVKRLCLLSFTLCFHSIIWHVGCRTVAKGVCWRLLYVYKKYLKMLDTVPCLKGCDNTSFIFSPFLVGNYRSPHPLGGVWQKTCNYPLNVDTWKKVVGKSNFMKKSGWKSYAGHVSKCSEHVFFDCGFLFFFGFLCEKMGFLPYFVIEKGKRT